MNKKTMAIMGFKEELKAVDAGLCPFCRKPIDLMGFKDEISRREFGISGLCQKCQDETFKMGEEE